MSGSVIVKVSGATGVTSCPITGAMGVLAMRTRFVWQCGLPRNVHVLGQVCITLTSRAPEANGIASATASGDGEGDGAEAAARAALFASSRRFWSARRHAPKLSKPSRCHFSSAMTAAGVRSESSSEIVSEPQVRRNQNPASRFPTDLGGTDFRTHGATYLFLNLRL